MACWSTPEAKQSSPACAKAHPINVASVAVAINLFIFHPSRASFFARACREAMIWVQAKVRVNGPVYHSVSMVVAAIDAMATLLTRDPEYLWARGSTMTERERQSELSCGSNRTSTRLGPRSAGRLPKHLFRNRRREAVSPERRARHRGLGASGKI